MGLIFQVLSQHQDLLNKTNTYLKSFKEKDIEEATITLRHHAYDLYTMLPQSIIIQANKFLIQNREPEWDVTEATTSKQFYEFFKTAIKVVMRKLPKNVQKMVYAPIFMKNSFVVNSFLINLSFKFRKDPSLR